MWEIITTSKTGTNIAIFRVSNINSENIILNKQKKTKIKFIILQVWIV